MSDIDLDRADVKEILREWSRRRTAKFGSYFPDCGPQCKADSSNKRDHVWRYTAKGEPLCCRRLYVPHLRVFHHGAHGGPEDRGYRERMFLKANRSGGTQAAAYEITCHLTGLYPWWWTGRRFDKPGEWWAAGETATTTRDVPQFELYGPPTAPRTGMIPGHLIVKRTMKSGCSDAIDTLSVRHITGGLSTCQFKSFKEGRTSFQGTAKHGIWLDEEPDPDIPEECLLRTATTQGVLLYTFTPLKGLTPFVASFLDSCDMVCPDGSVMLAKTEFWRQANMVEAA